MPLLFLTGASGALGTAIKEHYLQNGWQVAGFVHSQGSEQKVNYRSYGFNASLESSVISAFGKAIEEFGAPDALICTVGGVKPGKSIADSELSDVKELLETNFVTAFLSIKHAMRLMTNGGAIMTVGAEPAIRPAANRAAYASSKAALVHLTQTAAEEGKKLGISANCLVPVMLRTQANEAWGTPEEIQKWTTPKDFAELCFFLSSPAGRSVSGSVIRVPNRM